MTAAEYRRQARAQGLGAHRLGTAVSPDARAYEREFAPVRDRRVDPVVRPFDRIRDKRIGAASIARPTGSCRLDLGEVWAR